MAKEGNAQSDDDQQLLRTALVVPKFVCISIVVIVLLCCIQSPLLAYWYPLLSCEMNQVPMQFRATFFGMNSYVMTLGLALVFVHRRFRNCTRKTFDQKVAEGMPCSEITVIIPCFLPNEQDIIQDTIQHVMNKLQYPGKMKLIVVYNTPKDMPEVEGELHKMAEWAGYKDGRQLEIMRVHSSRSKAENLTYALSKTYSEYIVIYDADHHPDPGSLLRLYQEMWEQKADCVMGSLYIRNLNYSLMARWCDIDLFYSHFIILSGLVFWTRLGFFGGSNAILRKDALTSEKFNPAVQCEDIDLSARLLLENKKLVLCPEARCGELAPANYKAFYKQRLRWFMGWDQVTFKYIGQANFRSKLACYYKIVFPYIFLFRWIAPVAMALMLISVPETMGSIWLAKELRLVSAPAPSEDSPLSKCREIQGLATRFFSIFGHYVKISGATTSVLSLVEAMCQACNPDFQRSAFQCVLQFFSLVIYMVINPFYMIWYFVVEARSIYKILTNSTGDWVVTVRGSTAKNENTHLDSPLLGS